MMGKNGRIRVTEQFTWEIVSEKTLAVYRELVDR
jgi:glycosyltransferase involved in cell wall biosynthesis